MISSYSASVLMDRYTSGGVDMWIKKQTCFSLYAYLLCLLTTVGFRLHVSAKDADTLHGVPDVVSESFCILWLSRASFTEFRSMKAMSLHIKIKFVFVQLINAIFTLFELVSTMIWLNKSMKQKQMQ